MSPLRAAGLVLRPPPSRLGGSADADPTPVVAGGADAPRTLLVPLGVELLSNLCVAINPAFDSEIFLTAWHVFLFGAAEGGGPEVLVISTSDLLPMEELEENSISSSASLRSSAGAATSLPGSPTGRGVGE